MALGPDSPTPDPLTWLFNTAIRGILGKRPLGDITPGGVPIFSNFFERVRAAQIAQAQPLPSPPGFPTSTIPPRVPPRPGGVSIPDRIPGRVGTGAIGRILTSSPWGAILAGVFYPSTTATDDVLCQQTQYGVWCPPGLPAVPAPAMPGTRPGRRSRGRVARPGRRSRPRVANPVAPPRAQPRGRPLTNTRPRVIEQPRVETRAPPAPRSLPPPAASFPPPSSSTIPLPRTIPATIPASRALPALASLVLPAIGIGSSLFTGSQTRIGSQTNPLTGSRPITIPGTITLPGIGPSPSPLANLATNPLTSFNAAVAQSPAQELDRQCRERAKRKRKKKREPRKVCYRGTYVESSKSTRKTRKEKVPCQ
jgi:hypothetical protein